MANVITKLKVKSIAFCLNSNPSNRFKFILAKSDEDQEQDKIDELDDIIDGVDSLANQLSEGMQIVKSKVNDEANEDMQRSVASVLGISSVQKSEDDPVVDIWPSVPTREGNVMIYEKKETNHIEEEEEAFEETEDEFLDRCRDKKTALRLLEKGDMDRESILEAVGARAIKRSIESDTEGPEDSEIDKSDDPYPSLPSWFGRPGNF